MSSSSLLSCQRCQKVHFFGSPDPLALSLVVIGQITTTRIPCETPLADVRASQSRRRLRRVRDRRPSPPATARAVPSRAPSVSFARSHSAPSVRAGRRRSRSCPVPGVAVARTRVSSDASIVARERRASAVRGETRARGFARYISRAIARDRSTRRRVGVEFRRASDRREGHQKVPVVRVIAKARGFGRV